MAIVYHEANNYDPSRKRSTCHDVQLAILYISQVGKTTLEYSVSPVFIAKHIYIYTLSSQIQQNSFSLAILSFEFYHPKDEEKSNPSWGWVLV